MRRGPLAHSPQHGGANNSANSGRCHYSDPHLQRCPVRAGEGGAERLHGCGKPGELARRLLERGDARGRAGDAPGRGDVGIAHRLLKVCQVMANKRKAKVNTDSKTHW